ncbi:hypothetical protein FB566_1658 [Stackebrandtia endophytica]|uniref:Uncharacterized protein n=1 Tax=Stackebrandtia endophytica TaxID=1496996 RepID=A0A543AU94_9ACTN|nr:hypothetical protein FB566_1658 [Stackebrandtia endophytica]
MEPSGEPTSSPRVTARCDRSRQPDHIRSAENHHRPSACGGDPSPRPPHLSLTRVKQRPRRQGRPPPLDHGNQNSQPSRLSHPSSPTRPGPTESPSTTDFTPDDPKETCPPTTPHHVQVRQPARRDRNNRAQASRAGPKSTPARSPKQDERTLGQLARQGSTKPPPTTDVHPNEPQKSCKSEVTGNQVEERRLPVRDRDICALARRRRS